MVKREGGGWSSEDAQVDGWINKNTWSFNRKKGRKTVEEGKRNFDQEGSDKR